ncbi:MAG TPA: NAD(P)/FAD-dependent oxidoreductase, partial [Haliangiales bacterium]|nr:NAD(P)/FAD-dependent oxidoreductase [Haliangiales bacterium]
MRIVVVGAGPAGATAALVLARQKRHEVVLVDRDTFPRVKTCGSALSPRSIALLQELELAPVLRPKAYGICGLRFTGPVGRLSTMSGPEAAWVIPRAELDAEIAFAAERAGARFVQGVKVIRALRDASGHIRGVSDGKQEIEADLVLFADGAHSRFSEDTRTKRQIATIMGWWEGVSFQPGLVEMWFDRRVKPWYGWLFPETSKRVNIGICYDPADPVQPRDIFWAVVGKHVGARMNGADMVQRFRGAPIVYTERPERVSAPGALWIGEAARLTNAATGEGICYALQSGAMAAQLVGRSQDGALVEAYRQAIRRT